MEAWRVRWMTIASSGPGERGDLSLATSPSWNSATVTASEIAAGKSCKRGTLHVEHSITPWAVRPWLLEIGSAGGLLEADGLSVRGGGPRGCIGCSRTATHSFRDVSHVRPSQVPSRSTWSMPRLAADPGNWMTRRMARERFLILAVFDPPWLRPDALWLACVKCDAGSESRSGSGSDRPGCSLWSETGADRKDWAGGP